MDDLLIHRSEHTTIEQAYGFRVPGYLIVQPIEAVTRLGDLSREAAADLMECLQIAEQVVQESLDVERAYLLRFGEEDARIHFHVVPRSAALVRAYVDASGDEPPLSGAAIVDWVWQHHESLGHTDAEIGAFVVRARADLTSRGQWGHAPAR